MACCRIGHGFSKTLSQSIKGAAQIQAALTALSSSPSVPGCGCSGVHAAINHSHAPVASKHSFSSAALNLHASRPTMKALVKAKSEPGLEMHDVPVPVIRDDEVLIKIKKTALCGTDLHIWNWDEWAQKTVPVPLVTGHEYVGVIDQIGSHVKLPLTKGQLVSGEGHLTCGYCRRCRAGTQHLCRNTKGVGVNHPGAFAEYLALPASNVFPIPQNLNEDVAAVLDPLGNAVHTALKFDLVGEDVLILGAGPIGLFSIAIAKMVGARYICITDVNDYRLDIARKMGATEVINVAKDPAGLPGAMKRMGMKEGFDVCLEMSGNAGAFQSAMKVMNNGGRISFLGVPSKPFELDWSDVIFKGLTITGIYGREMYETWYKMINLLQGGLDITPVITARYPAADFEAAFKNLKGGQNGKVILDWQ